MRRLGVLTTAVCVAALTLLDLSGLRWDWVPTYAARAADGFLMTVALLLGSSTLGFMLALALGLAQAQGPKLLAAPAWAFCTVIRGTPLLLQLWMLYYGLGSLLAAYPGLRSTWAWPILREAWPYAALALTLSFAGYVAEVMRGAFLAIPRGEIEAARAFGMTRRALFHRILLPQAVARALPALSGEVILQLKATPLVATISVVDLYALATRVRQDLLLVYEPLLMIAAVYLLAALGIVAGFRRLEDRYAIR
jgi:polar amino acid transport system permease protein